MTGSLNDTEYFKPVALSLTGAQWIVIAFFFLKTDI